MGWGGGGEEPSTLLTQITCLPKTVADKAVAGKTVADKTVADHP